jgi:PAS domain S-box-containing protein
LALTLALAIPEIALQEQVRRETLLVIRAVSAAQTARAVEDARLTVAGILRRRLASDGDGSDFKPAMRDLQGSALRLESLADSSPGQIERARDVAAVAMNLVARFRFVDAERQRGRADAARAILASPAYLGQITKLQRTIRAFIANERDSQAALFASLERLRSTSLVLFALAIVGLALSSGLLLYHSQRAVEAILELGKKSKRYRNREPLGAPSQRRDEIGELDAALYEFVAAQAIRERELERYRLLAEVTRDVIWFIDRKDLTIVDANASALATYGYERDQILGKPIAMLREPGNEISAEQLALTDTPAGLAIEAVHKRSDGSLFPVEIRGRTALIDGRSTLLITIRDITERRQAAEQIAMALERAVEASRLKSEFVATMSHEIRTPMQGVIGMIELLLRTSLDDVQRKYATTVYESAEALLTIINDILDFSKLASNKLALEDVPFDPVALVASVIELCRGAARNKGIELLLDTARNVPRMVSGDPNRLRQVLTNLVGNAVKFTAQGSVRVSTSVEHDGDSVLLLFAVSDTGIGIAPASRQRLFEAFVQGDGTTTRRFGGTGLGLSISRHLVELMGGRIWLGEHEGPGATFCFTARFGRAVEGEAAALGSKDRRQRARPTPRNGRRARILLAEDNPLIRDVASSQLAELDYAADIVENGEQALEAVSQGVYELVLMNMQMPLMDGLAATRAIRDAERKTGRHIPIIALTANAMDRDREACREAGMDDFLAKPLDLAALHAVLERWLSPRLNEVLQRDP